MRFAEALRTLVLSWCCAMVLAVEPDSRVSTVFEHFQGASKHFGSAAPFLTRGDSFKGKRVDVGPGEHAAVPQLPDNSPSNANTRSLKMATSVTNSKRDKVKRGSTIRADAVCPAGLIVTNVQCSSTSSKFGKDNTPVLGTSTSFCRYKNKRVGNHTSTVKIIMTCEPPPAGAPIVLTKSKRDKVKRGSTIRVDENCPFGFVVTNVECSSTSSKFGKDNTPKLGGASAFCRYKNKRVGNHTSTVKIILRCEKLNTSEVTNTKRDKVKRGSTITANAVCPPGMVAKQLVECSSTSGKFERDIAFCTRKNGLDGQDCRFKNTKGQPSTGSTATIKIRIRCEVQEGAQPGANPPPYKNPVTDDSLTCSLPSVCADDRPFDAPLAPPRFTLSDNCGESQSFIQSCQMKPDGSGFMDGSCAYQGGPGQTASSTDDPTGVLGVVWRSHYVVRVGPEDHMECEVYHKHILTQQVGGRQTIKGPCRAVCMGRGFVDAQSWAQVGITDGRAWGVEGKSSHFGAKTGDNKLGNFDEDEKVASVPYDDSQCSQLLP